MNQAINMKVNRLPARTWNWLRMNESVLHGVLAPQACALRAQGGGGLAPFAHGGGPFSAMPTGMGPDMARLARQSGAQPLRLKAPAGAQAGTLWLHAPLAGQEHCFAGVHLWAAEGSRITVIMDYSSPRGADGLAAVQTKLYAEKNAVLRLVQVQMLGGGFTFLNDVGAVCEEGGRVELLQLFLGGERTYAGCEVQLAGAESSFSADIGYFGRASQAFDMNYNAVHHGPRSQSRMCAQGVLGGQAFKLFRGTLDFKAGAAGAQGEETENVLLVSDSAVNQTVPLILCGEEDVQGSHGATIGRLDDEVLFYLCSRGLSEAQAVRLVTRARLDALCRQIGDEPAQAAVQAYLEEVLQDDI